MPSLQAEPAVRVLHLRVPNQRTALEPTRLRLLDFLAGDALPDAVVYRLELVLEEVLMNRLWHGQQQGAGQQTDLMLQVGPHELLLRFEDDGPAFDPTQVRHAPPPTALQDAVPGGLGLLLTRKAVSAWSYERVLDRNCLTLQLARP